MASRSPFAIRPIRTSSDVACLVTNAALLGLDAGKKVSVQIGNKLLPNPLDPQAKIVAGGAPIRYPFPGSASPDHAGPTPDPGRPEFDGARSLRRGARRSVRTRPLGGGGGRQRPALPHHRGAA